MAVPTSLFEQIRVSGYTLPSRVTLAPINTGYARFGQPTSRLLQFHKNRSGPEIGIGMVGNVALSDASVTNAGTLALKRTADVSRFAVLARCISRQGSLPGIQLGFSPPGLAAPTNWVAKDRGHELERLRALILAFSDAYLTKVLESFAVSAALAAKAGFDVIQVNAAHGYLLALLLNPLTNRRIGELRPEGPWLSRLIEGVQAAAAPRLVSVRLSLFSGLRDDNSEEIAFVAEISRGLARAGVHILDFSSGFYTVNKRLIYPGIEKGVIPFYEVVRTIAASLNCIVCLSGNITDFRNLPTIGDKMIVSVGRALIADPNFLRKTRLGHFDAIVRCKRTGRCHYFSRGKCEIECGVNSEFVRISPL